MIKRGIGEYSPTAPVQLENNLQHALLLCSCYHAPFIRVKGGLMVAGMMVGKRRGFLVMVGIMVLTGLMAGLVDGMMIGRINKIGL